MVRIGLTGGIATGKTTMTRHLRSLGIPVIEADVVSREVLEIYPEIGEYLRSTYGEAIYEDGVLDRKALGRIIFQSEDHRKRYRDVIMPRIRQEIEKRLRETQDELVVLDAPLLFEEDFQKDVDVTITVYAREEVQLARLMERDGYTKDEARRRIAAQMDLREKMRLSDFVIDNSGSLEESLQELDGILERIGIDYGKEKKIEKEKKDI